MGLYTSTGAFNVALNDTTSTGRYSASGALRVNIVSGSSYVGLYAADGALNVVDVSGISTSTYGGLYHPSGALRGRTAPDTFSGLQAPDGSYYFNGLFNPLNLFSAGEQGVWFDPSDLSTMFQDSAGTTPVTAVEQPVGRILDKSGRGNNATQATSASRPVLSARVNLLLATATLATQNVTTAAATYTLAFSGTGTITTSGTNVGVYSAGSNSLVCTAGTLTLTVSGSVTSADLRVTNTGVGLPAYQAVVTSTDYDTINFPLYLRFDGTDDFLATGSINPGAGVKAQMFAGVRAETPRSNNSIVSQFGDGTTSATDALFSLRTGDGSTDSYRATLIGSGANQTARVTKVVPYTAVFSTQNDAAATGAGEISLRENGTVTASGSATDSGLTSFGSQVIYIGRQSNATGYFNGKIYSLIVRFGANLSSSTIVSAENYVNTKTKGY